MERTTLFVVLGGLLILTLVLASIAQRYQAYVEERRRRIERILQRVSELEEMVGRLRGLPAPPQVAPLLLRDMLARLEVIANIYPRQPGLAGLVARISAEQAAEHPAPLSAAALDEASFERLMRGLGQVHWLLQERRLVVPLDEAARLELMQSIAMARAEALYRFHRRMAERRLAEEELHQALWHINQVRRFLRDEAPSNPSTEAWYREFEGLYREIAARLNGQSAGESPASPSE